MTDLFKLSAADFPPIPARDLPLGSIGKLDAAYREDGIESPQDADERRSYEATYPGSAEFGCLDGDHEIREIRTGKVVGCIPDEPTDTAYDLGRVYPKGTFTDSGQQIIYPSSYTTYPEPTPIRQVLAILATLGRMLRAKVTGNP